MKTSMNSGIPNRASVRRRAAGVTLIELLVVVTVLGILVAIATPSYRQYAMRAHRTEAKTALLNIATNQERYYLQNNSYATLAQLAAANYPTTSEHDVYTLTIATTNGWGLDYTATAVPTPGGGTDGVDQSTDADCATFTISSTGARTATPDPDGRCW